MREEEEESAHIISGSFDWSSVAEASFNASDVFFDCAPNIVLFFFSLCVLVQAQSWDGVPLVSLLPFPETCLQ